MRAPLHLVVAGGPGAGKSTLTTKLAHVAAKRGDVVFHARLPQIARRIEEGDTYDIALRRVAVEQSGLHVSAVPDLLLLDGLDECDPKRAAVAEQIAAWATARPRTSVWVTTRYVGHSVELLPDFRHAELPRPKPAEVFAIADALLSASEPDSSRRDAIRAALENLLRDPERAAVAELVTRAPLFLTFFVRLVQGGRIVPSNRAELYRGVITALQVTEPTNRHTSSRSVPVGAERLIARIAFIAIQRDVATRQELIAAAVASLPEIRPDEAESRIVETLQFWEDRRLIETISFAFERAVTFIHPSFGEYLTSEHIRSLSEADLSTWLRTAYRQPRWREPILLAAAGGDAERVIAELMRLDDAVNPASTAAFLAAACIAEAQTASAEALAVVTDALVARLNSSQRLVIVEAGIALRDIAKVAPSTVRVAVAPFIRSDCRWTRIAAVGALAACGGTAAQILSKNNIREFLDAFETPPIEHGGGKLMLRSADVPSEALRLFKAATPDLITALLEIDSDEATRAYIARVAFDRTASGEIENFRDVCRRYGPPGWFDDAMNEQYQKMTAVFNADIWMREDDTDRKILRIFAEIFAKTDDDLTVRDDPAVTAFPQIARLFDALGLLHQLTYEYKQTTAEKYVDDLRSVVIATAHACDIDELAIVEELKVARSRIRADEPAAILAITKTTPANIDWARAGLVADFARICSSLDHSAPAISFTATCILDACWREEFVDGILRALHSNRRQAVRSAAYLLRHVSAERQISAFYDRLQEPITSPCAAVYESLGQLCTLREPEIRLRANELIIAGVTVDNAEAAIAATEQVHFVTDVDNNRVISALRSANTQWLSRSVLCPSCGTRTSKSSCERCHRVLMTPRPALIRELGRRGALDSEEILGLLTDRTHGVADAAKECLQRHVESMTELGSLVAGLAANPKSRSEILRALLTLPVDRLRPIADDLLSLARIPECQNPIVDSMRRGWAPTRDARNVLDELLADGADRHDDVIRVMRILS